MSKTLKNVLDKSVNVPKSYMRYLTCKVVDSKEDTLHVETPKGTIVIFKIENDSLKRVGTSSFDEHSSASLESCDESSEDGKNPKNVMFISLQEWNDIQKKWESTLVWGKELKEQTSKLENIAQQISQLQSTNSNPTEDLSIFAKKLENITQQMSQLQSATNNPTEDSSLLSKKLEQAEKRISQLENANNNPAEDLSILTKKLEKIEQNYLRKNISNENPATEENLQDQVNSLSKIEALEKRIQILESRPSFLDKNKQYVGKALDAAKKSESVHKAKEKSKGFLLFTGSSLLKLLKYLFSHPKVSASLAVVVCLFVFKPWQYIAATIDTSGNNENVNSNYINYDNKDIDSIVVNQNKEDYIIPKNKTEDKSTNTDTNTSIDKNTNTNTNQITKENNFAKDTAREKEYREWAKEEEKFYLEARRKIYDIPHLQEWLEKAKSSIEEYRIEAAREMANSEDREAGGPLLKMLSDTSEGVRWQAIRGIGKLEYDAAAYGLLKIIENKQEKLHLRIEAMVSVSRLRTTKTVYVLKKVLLDSNEDVEVRANAIESLGLIGDANVSVDILTALTTTNEHLLQIACIRALGRFGYPPAYTIIVDILKTTEDIEIKIECIKALGGITNKANKIVTILLEIWERKEYDLQEPLKDSLLHLLPHLDDNWKEKVSDIVN